ncbi:MAG TPA: CpsD/CapB family tyrosine-protein kinase [Candidatus Acidoferrum sp.]
MSRNFELMQQAGQPQSTPLHEPSVPFSIPTEARSSITHQPAIDSLTREQCLKLIQNVFLLPGKDSPKTIVFAGVDSGNGTSAICANAARLLAAQINGSVCLVDANLHSPSLPESFGVGNHFGLTDSLRKEGAIRDFVKPVGPDNLWLLSCGSLAAESAGNLNADAFKARLVELRAAFDYVLIDSPSLNNHSDAIAFGQMADGLILVIEANSTRREAAASITKSLRAAHVSILGAVLNKRTFPIPSALYHRI